MTFKHIKFSDSATMRSLEKVAKEKGLVQPESLEKTAAKKKDYSVTDNLTENIIKLCNGLRDHGLTKYADELENKFMNYKKADGLYQTSRETGEDLVDTAHPHGSHKLEGVEGDSVIETIVDQQMKDLEIVNKTPTGKLSKAEAINKVKIVLAQENNQTLDMLKAIVDNLSSISQLYHNESILTRPLLAGSPDDLLNFAKSIKSPTAIDFSKVVVDAGKLYWDYKPNFLGGGVSSGAWEEMEPLFRKVFGAARQGKELLQNPPQAKKDETIAKLQPEVQSLMDAFNDVSKRISRYKSIIEAKSPANINELNAYLDKVSNSIANRVNSFSKIDNENKVEISKIYLDKLNNEIIPGLNAFEGNYVRV